MICSVLFNVMGIGQKQSMVVSNHRLLKIMTSCDALLRHESGYNMLISVSLVSRCQEARQQALIPAASSQARWHRAQPQPASSQWGQAQDKAWPGSHAGKKDIAGYGVAMTWCRLRTKAEVKASPKLAGTSQFDSSQPTPTELLPSQPAPGKSGWAPQPGPPGQERQSHRAPGGRGDNTVHSQLFIFRSHQ